MNFPTRFISWGVDYQGSSRATGIIRPGLAFLIWGRFGNHMLPMWELETFHFAFRIFFFVSTFAMAIGFFSRWACAASACCLGIIYFYLGQTPHHVYLLFISTAFLVLAPVEKSLSVDRWIALKRAERRNLPPPEEYGNLLGLRLITCQLVAIYFWAAVGKMTPAFLRGERFQHLLAEFYGGIDFSAMPGFEWLCAAAGAGTALLEAALVVGLVAPGFRRVFIPAGIVFHLLIYLFFPVHTFSATMILLYLALIPADDFQGWLDWMQGRPPGSVRKFS